MKRKTKEQREREAKAALRQRVADIATGAAGYPFDTDEQYATAEFLSRFVVALKLQLSPNDRACVYSNHCIHHFDTVDSTTDHLWEHGIRA